MAIIYDNDLDPFGDGSLKQSWKFENSGADEQGISTFQGITGHTGGKFGNCLTSASISADNFATDAGHGFAGEQDLSVSYWFRWKSGETYAQGYMVFGGDDPAGDRYAMNTYVYEYGGVTTLALAQHKNAFNGSITLPTLTNNQWYHIAYTYEAATDTARVYFDGVLKITAVGQMKWINNPITLFTTFTLPRWYDQLMTFTKTLSLSEIQDLTNMEVYVPPSPHTATPSTVSLSIAIELGFKIITETAFSGAIVTDIPTMTITPLTMQEFGTIPIPYTAHPTELAITINIMHPGYIGQVLSALISVELLQEIVSERAYIEADIIQPIEQKKNAIIIERQ